MDAVPRTSKRRREDENDEGYNQSSERYGEAEGCEVVDGEAKVEFSRVNTRSVVRPGSIKRYESVKKSSNWIL